MSYYGLQPMIIFLNGTKSPWYGSLQQKQLTTRSKLHQPTPPVEVSPVPGSPVGMAVRCAQLHPHELFVLRDEGADVAHAPPSHPALRRDHLDPVVQPQIPRHSGQKRLPALWWDVISSGFRSWRPPRPLLFTSFGATRDHSSKTEPLRGEHVQPPFWTDRKWRLIISQRYHCLIEYQVSQPNR